MRSRYVETRGDRRALVAAAGVGPVSFTSVMSGVLVSYGAFAILLAAAAAITAAIGIDTDLGTDWEQLGTVGGLIVALIVFLSYLFGGYVAGRMARRKGVTHGLLTAALAVALVAAVAAIGREATDAQGVIDNLRSLGIPTTADEYGYAATVAGIGSLLALFLGSILGGAIGEQWHGHILTRAVDPTVGPDAELGDERRGAAEAIDDDRTDRTRPVKTRNHDWRRGERTDGDIDPEDVLDRTGPSRNAKATADR